MKCLIYYTFMLVDIPYLTACMTSIQDSRLFQFQLMLNIQTVKFHAFILTELVVIYHQVCFRNTHCWLLKKSCFVFQPGSLFRAGRGSQSCTWNAGFMELLWQRHRAKLTNLTAFHSPFVCAVTHASVLPLDQSHSLTYTHTRTHLASTGCYITLLLLSFRLTLVLPPSSSSPSLYECVFVCVGCVVRVHVRDSGSGVRTGPCGVWLTSAEIQPW